MESLTILGFLSILTIFAIVLIFIWAFIGTLKEQVHYKQSITTRFDDAEKRLDKRLSEAGWEFDGEKFHKI